MADVHLRPISLANYRECLNLQVTDSQIHFVASNAKSLAEAKVNETLVPLAIYDAAARGYETPSVPMVGFTMYEVTAGVGFILRLMVDQAHQGKGYGHAAMSEVIRRLRLLPEVEMIATSHLRENSAAAALYQRLGFVAWEVAWSNPDEAEVFLRLP